MRVFERRIARAMAAAERPGVGRAGSVVRASDAFNERYHAAQIAILQRTGLTPPATPERVDVTFARLYDAMPPEQRGFVHCFGYATFDKDGIADCD
jgi:hypothetical protein